METYEIKMLRKDLEALRKRVDDLTEAQKTDRENHSSLIKEVYTNSYQRIADIYDLLWPVVHKIFPDYSKTKRQIDGLIKRPRRGGKKAP